MNIIDISMEIRRDMAVFKNKEEKIPRLRIMSDYNVGSTYESNIDMNMHTGTHVDAPLHMIEGGDTIENLDLSQVVTPCRVIDLTGLKDSITAADLVDKNIKKGEFLLFKTRNSFTEEFDFNFVFIEKSGAEYLRSLGIKGVGIDGLGIERSQPDHESHISLMGAGVTIVEGLRLAHVSEGEYQLVALPLKIKGAEAAPARAILISE